MFIFMCAASVGMAALSASGQGIGDRNRASSGGTHIISGKVLLPDGRPATGVRVNLSGGDFTQGNTTTDSDGAFIFSGIPAGNYNVSVRAEGYQTENERLTIERFAAAGQGYQMAVHLRAPGQERSGANPMLAGVPKDAASKFEKGMEKLSKNDAKGSVADFDAAIAAYPKFAAAYYEKGAAHLKQKETDKALAAFVKAIELKPDYVEAKYGVGQTQFLNKNYEVAAAVYGDVIKERKDMTEAYMNLGISLYYLKNVDAAETSLKTAIAMKDSDKYPLAHRYLGAIYAQKKRNAEAAAELEKYLELTPKAPDADRVRSIVADLKKKS